MAKKVVVDFLTDRDVAKLTTLRRSPCLDCGCKQCVCDDPYAPPDESDLDAYEYMTHGQKKRPSHF